MLTRTIKLMDFIRRTGDTDQGANYLNAVIPKLLILCQSQIDEKIREIALYSLNTCIFTMPPALSQCIKQFLQILLASTQDASPKIRIRGFQGIISLNETRQDHILEILEDVIKLII